MTGVHTFPSVMDTILNDKVYFSLFSFLERCNNFFGNSQSLILKDFKNEHGSGTAFEIHNDRCYFSSYRNDNLVLTIKEQEGWINNCTSSFIIAYNNAVNTDMSALKNIHQLCDYDQYGWMVRDHIITDEMESELFQWSTVHDVYSIENLQEVMNRVRNLPLSGNQRLEISQDFRHPMFYTEIDKLLKGY